MLQTLVAIAAFTVFAAAQTTTDCSPLNSTCPANAALGTTYSVTFNESTTELNTDLFNITAGSSLISFGSTGAELSLAEKGDVITVESTFYIFFGQLEIIFQAAAGAGIVSTAILLSQDLDEIDFEYIGASTTNVSTNWYGEGNQTQNNGEVIALANGTTAMHNYTVDWTKESLQYILDGTVVRTVAYNTPGLYPQTPCRLQFGMWSAGDSSSAGTVAWAGGTTDWTNAPFVMTIQSIRMTDGATNASSYTYGNHSGSYASIDITSGESAAYTVINAVSDTQAVVNTWDGLSTAAKIGVACGVIGGFSLAMLAFCIYCMLQRKKGRAEKKIADKEWDDHQNELMQYRRMQAKGQFAVSSMSAKEGNRF